MSDKHSWEYWEPWDTWIKKFCELNEDCKLLVAEDVAKELKYIEEDYDEKYDNEKSKSIRELLISSVESIRDKCMLTQLSNLLDRIDVLPDDYKKALLNSTIEKMSENCEYAEKRIAYENRNLEKERKREICKKEGHDYSDWECKEITDIKTSGPTGIEAALAGYSFNTYEVKYFIWKRRCQRCGNMQITTKKPVEVEAKETEEKIATLQKKLKQLNNKKSSK